MEESTSREKVLKRIRSALISKTPNPYPNLETGSGNFYTAGDVPELTFAKSLRNAGGHFIFCEDMLEFAESFLDLIQEMKWKEIFCYSDDLKDFLEHCEFPLSAGTNESLNHAVAVTFAESLIARTGSVLLSSAMGNGRALPAYSSALVVVCYTNQIVNDIDDAFQEIFKKYPDELPSSFTMVTGPSSTADIGNELIVGAQGPASLFLFMIDKP
jgi:L-lactate dehydrogenase complex protein LldG